MFVSNTGGSPAAPGPTGPTYQVPRSLRLRSSATARLSRVISAAATRTTFTESFWVKRSNIGAQGELIAYYNGSNVNSQTDFLFEVNDTLAVQDYNGAVAFNLTTTQVFRDPSAWYHIVFVLDTTNATAGERARLYVNGARVTSFTTATYPALNYQSQSWQTGATMTVGAKNTLGPLDGYLADVYFIDGQALDPSYFGQTDSTWGTWTAKAYTGTYGTNGFYLPFNNTTSTTTLCQDVSGNGNNWTPNNISLTAGATYDSMYDVPLGAGSSVGNGLGNYATLNPIFPESGTGSFGTVTPTYSDGNLSASIPNVDTSAALISSTCWTPTSGKWYAEIVRTAVNSGGYVAHFGISNNPLTSIAGLSEDWSGRYAYASDGTKVIPVGAVSAYGATWAVNDVIGIALDVDAGTLTFYKNGVSQGGISVAVAAYRIIARGTAVRLGSGDTIKVNFGQQPFTYTPPVGYLALHTGNLPAPTIQKPNQYFDAVTYTGAVSNLSVPTNAFPDSAPADPRFSSVALLLHGEGANGGTVFTDSSPSPKTLTRTGAAQTSTVQKKFGNSSISLASSDQVLVTPSAGLALTGDFTIELFFLTTDATADVRVLSSTEGIGTGFWSIRLRTSSINSIAFDYYNGSGYASAGSINGSFMDGAWHHLAVTRANGTIRVFLDGVLGASSTYVGTIGSSTATVYVGGLNPSNPSARFTGYIDEVRITNGVARYPINTVTNPGAFQPDLVWIKSRSAATDNKLTDSVRGVTKAVVSNTATAETTDTGGVTAFNSNGFTLGSDTNYNTASATYVAWQWKANGAAATNTSGTITSQVSANPSAGFSVVTYTGTNNDGATVGHGLGVVPRMIVVRGRNFAANTRVFHSSLSANNNLYLNGTGVQDVITATGGGGIGTSPTSSVYTCVTGSGANANNVNQNTWTYVAYCFAPVAGYSAFGSYTGNANADGSFVYCGFRPRYVLIKSSTAVDDWRVYDAIRPGRNVQGGTLLADTAGAETTVAEIDLLSNGFKLRIATTPNAAQTYIYAAFAENPFRHALAR